MRVLQDLKEKLTSDNLFPHDTATTHKSVASTQSGYQEVIERQIEVRNFQMTTKWAQLSETYREAEF